MVKKVYSFSATNVVVFSTVLVGLLILNGFLFYQNRDLKIASVSRTREIAVKNGANLTPLKGIDLNSEKQSFEWGLDNRKTLVMIFSAQCGYCHENMPIWKEIINKADNSSLRIVGVASSSIGIREFVQDEGVKFM